MSIFEKPPKEDRIAFTFTKADKDEFIKLLALEGIPIIDWESESKENKMYEFSTMHFLRWAYDEITKIKKELGLADLSK